MKEVSTSIHHQGDLLVDGDGDGDELTSSSLSLSITQSTITTTTESLTNNNTSINVPVPLNRALDSMCLAYNPLTRQLHFLPAKVPVPVQVPVQVSSDGSVSSTSTQSSLSLSSSGDEDLGQVQLQDTNVRQNKKKGLAGLFTRSVFTWRSNNNVNGEPKENCENGNGWKFFNGSRVPPSPGSREESICDSPPDHPASSSSGGSTPMHRRQGSNASAGSESKQFENLVASSIALIQHNRPSNLPAKDTAEEIRHRQEYQRIVEAARRREAREARERKKQLEKQAKHEDELSANVREWNQNILPSWENMKYNKKTRDLWWCGLPPAVRGKVWQLAIPNNLNITPQLYHICVERAKQRLIEVKVRKNGYKIHDDVDMTSYDEVDYKQSNGDLVLENSDSEVKLSNGSMIRNCSEQNFKKPQCDAFVKVSQSNPELCKLSNEHSMELIQLDIARTFPHLCIFQPGGPYFDVLHELLAAYVCYRPDIGYVQGMSFLAAILILNMDAPEAFICFSNLLNGPVLRAAFTLDGATMQVVWNLYSYLMEANLPMIHKHFKNSAIGPELYFLEWLYSMFAKAMPLDVACRVWDVFLRDGEEFLFKAALGVLHLYQEELIHLDFITASQFLTKLPEDMSSDALFKSINSININVDKLSFQQLFEKFKETSNQCDY